MTQFWTVLKGPKPALKMWATILYWLLYRMPLLMMVKDSVAKGTLALITVGNGVLRKLNKKNPRPKAG